MMGPVRADTVQRAIDPVYAALAIESATDRDRIFELVLRAARAHTRFAALLMVQGDSLRGVRAFADPRYDASRVESLQILRNTVPAFETAITSCAPSVGSIATGEPFADELLELLGGRAKTAVVLPIAVDGKTCALVVAHRGSAGFTADDVSELLPLAAASTAALDRLRQVRVRAATVAPRQPRRDTTIEIEITYAPPERRQSTLSDLRASESWNELADALRDLVRAGMETGEPGEDEQCELLLELGHLEADRLGRVDKAIEAWRSALAIDARDERALDALEQTFVKHGRWHECARLLEQRVALSDDVSPRVARLLELAAISHERLGDDEAAVAAYERVLDLVPEHPTATRELETLYARTGQWDAIATLLLDRAARAGEPADRIAALETVARMYEDKSRDRHGAFLVWSAVLRSAPERDDVVEQLARLGPGAGIDAVAEGSALAEELETGHAATAARLWHLVGTWGKRGRSHDAIGALTRAYALEQDPARRCEICVELATLHEAIGSSPSEVITAYERALENEPESITVLSALHDLYRRTEDDEGLAAVLPQRISITSGPPGAIVELWVELGNLLADRLQRYDEALHAFTTARGLSPNHRAALQGCARVYQATGRTDELLEAREHELDAGGGAARATGYAEVATAWEDRGRPDRAAGCRRKQLQLAPLDLAAHEGLVRALRLNEEWSALAEAIPALIPLIPASERTALYLELADIRDIRQGDVDAAIAAYTQVLAHHTDHPVALDRLAYLHDRAGQYKSALEILGRQLATETAPRMRADLLQRMGHVNLNARDFAKARIHLDQALELDPSNADAHEGIGWLHVHEQALPAAGDELVRAAQLTDDRHDRMRRYTEAAWLYWHRLRDADKARACLNAILSIDPDHADAKLALTELLADQRKWEDLWPRLELEVTRSGEDESIAAATRADLHARAARCALEIDKFDRANALFKRAAELDPSPALQLERAEALVRSRSLEEAAAAYQTLVDDSATLDRPLRVRLHRKLAEVNTMLGRLGQAHKNHHDVLALEPEHADTLRDLVDLEVARGKFDDAVAHLKMLATSGPAEARVGCLERIGDIYRERLHNPVRAISTYLEALELAKGNRRLLQRVLDVQTETGQWRAAVDTIAQFIEHESEPARRASYHLAEAEIRRTELRDRPGALAAYERALDDLFRESSEASRRRGLDVFMIIDGLLTADGEWRPLEKAYVRMIKRLAKTDPALVTLWHALGELYRLHLDNAEHALAAFEVAASLDPHPSTLRTRILAELRAKLAPPAESIAPVAPARAAEPSPPPRARPPRAQTPLPVRPATPLRAVTAPPERPSLPSNVADGYRAIGQTAAAAGRVDEAWCVMRALVLIRAATPDERALYMHYRPQERREATGMLDEDSWSFVRHADEDRTISAIFAQIWQSAALQLAQPTEAFELKPKERVPVEDGGRLIARICRYGAGVLDVALPEVYIQAHRAGRLHLANRVERGRLLPTLIVGRDLLSGYRESEITGELATMMAQLRPAYLLNLALPTVDDLEAALAAAASVVGRKNLGIGTGAPVLRIAIAKALEERLLGPQLGALRGLVGRLPERPDLAMWRHAVAATARRAALLVCGELVATARMIATDPALNDPDLAGRRVEELVAYSVSPKYFAARAQLGVTVG